MGVTRATSWRAKGTVTSPYATVSLGRKSTSTQPMPKEATMSTSINIHRIKAESLSISVFGDDTITIKCLDDNGSYTKVHFYIDADGTSRQALEQLLNQVIAGIVTSEINLESLSNQ